MLDITYCTSKTCQQKDCLRHKENYPKEELISVSNLGENQPKSRNCKYFIDKRQVSWNDKDKT